MLNETIERWNEMARAFVWGAPMLVLLIGTGVYFTAKTHLFQLRHMGLWLRKTLFSCFTGEARRKSSGGVSPFGVMCTALAATVGTGNIAGVATALTIGGPGAVFWMWISAFFGMMTAFTENTLGMLYRERGKDGAWRGGPMMYLKKGLHSPFLAGAFALFCVLASFGIGNMSQCNSIAGGLRGVFGVPPQVTGLVTAVLLGAVLLGGLGRISRVTETLVPFMALFYMGGALFVLWCFRANLPQACGQILSAAFDWRAGVGGAAGYGMMQAIRIGVSRGVFSNEAGLGSSVMVHAAADAKEPCETEIVRHDFPGVCPSLRSRSMNFVSFDRADLFEDGLEVRALVGTERARDVLPDDIPRIFSIGCTPHFFYNPYCLIKEVTP